MDERPRIASIAQNVAAMATVDLRIELHPTDDGLWNAHLERNDAADGAHWACDSDPQVSRLAAILDALKVAAANNQLE
jgi:hypothetical protein